MKEFIWKIYRKNAARCQSRIHYTRFLNAQKQNSTKYLLICKSLR